MMNERDLFATLPTIDEAVSRRLHQRLDADLAFDVYAQLAGQGPLADAGREERGKR